MSTKLFSLALLSTALLSTAAFSSTINMGYVSFDVTNPPLAQVDIVNLTGANSAPPDFPVSTSVSLTDLNLTVSFSTGPAETFSSSSGYFSLDPDGLSFDGEDIFNTTTDPVTSITLTGNYATTSITSGGAPVTIEPGFSATITDPSGTLADGDFALLTATTAATGTIAPEPGSILLFSLGLIALAALASKRLGSLVKLAKAGKVSLLLAIACVGLFASAVAPVKLASNTSPSSGTSGSTQVWVTGSGFPSGSFVSVTATLATTCGGTGTAAPGVSEVAIVGTTEKVEFLVPASLASGLYYVSIAGSTTGGAFNSGSSCSAIQVTHTSTVLASCNPGSSMGILAYNPTGAAATPITAYVPNGYWEGGDTGVQVVPLEGSGSPATITTAQSVNSCSSNSETGETVCIDNYTDIYLINGTTLSATLNSAANTYASFSGGDCENCTVAVNEAAGTKGQAVIGIGYSSAPGGSALQFLDLATNTLGPPVLMNYLTSEDILWDPFLNTVLSPDEEGSYNLYSVTGSGVPGPASVTELSNYQGNYFDSAAEDCTTHIALSSIEAYPTGFYITDLTQKTVSNGTYTSPGQYFSAPEFQQFSAATDGIAVAPGSTHLAVITGEFGGNQFGAISLPATSGTGTPAPADYVAAVLPSSPDGCGYSSGYDPHTTTAYTSPNNGKAYGVLADWQTGSPDYLAVVDLAALLAAPRVSGIYPDGSYCPNCTNVVNPAYDLVANGVVKYIPTGNPNCSVAYADRAAKDSAAKPKPANKMPGPK